MTGKSGVKRESYMCREDFPSMYAQIICTDKLVLNDICWSKIYYLLT